MIMTYNFSAGPAVLPKAVMEKAQAEFTDYQGLGYGIMEASHRSPEFTAVIETAEKNLRELLNISDDYAVLFLQGGASTQFAMLPMNFAQGKTVDYVDTGSWSSKAAKEAKLFSNVNVAASSKDENYSYLPAIADWNLSDDATYLHITSNNTIFGTQFHEFPQVDAPLIADMSSDILSRELDIDKFAVIYAGAQKNIGPSGVTVVIINKDFAAKEQENLPAMLSYGTHIDKDSLYNTPPTFGIYMIGLVAEWLLANGGIKAMQEINERKAGNLYAEIDADDFYSCPTNEANRSLMNVCFNLATPELEAAFIAEAKTKGLVGLKGHRSVGGIRASIYNAMPEVGVQALVDFMKEFRVNN
ncbi:MAG: 3-phosphoserine/phosphohydroxythreonine transaminase [Lentisphaeria bacterium]|nr:3-phosphoserine/phosphohydroxythreonine transaminase [Lentisphaeria bacterium]